jgi:hypothetical protein
MKNIILAAVMLSFALYGSGCSANYNLRALAGTNVRDLEAAKSSGKTRTFSMSYSDTYDKTLRVLSDNKLTVYGENRNKGLIIAMGFTKQVNTTRVGIFLTSVDESSTQVTISSLSATCLDKAAGVIFGGLEK